MGIIIDILTFNRLGPFFSAARLMPAAWRA